MAGCRLKLIEAKKFKIIKPIFNEELIPLKRKKFFFEEE